MKLFWKFVQRLFEPIDCGTEQLPAKVPEGWANPWDRVMDELEGK